MARHGYTSVRTERDREVIGHDIVATGGDRSRQDLASIGDPHARRGDKRDSEETVPATTGVGDAKVGR
jgi:hypothetical protein